MFNIHAYIGEWFQLNFLFVRRSFTVFVCVEACVCVQLCIRQREFAELHCLIPHCVHEYLWICELLWVQLVPVFAIMMFI